MEDFIQVCFTGIKVGPTHTGHPLLWVGWYLTLLWTKLVTIFGARKEFSLQVYWLTYLIAYLIAIIRVLTEKALSKTLVVVREEVPSLYLPLQWNGVSH